jgi:hypothetical protein
MDHFRINSFEQKIAALVFSVQYAQWAIHTNNTINKNPDNNRQERISLKNVLALKRAVCCNWATGGRHHW